MTDDAVNVEVCCGAGFGDVTFTAALGAGSAEGVEVEATAAALGSDGVLPADACCWACCCSWNLIRAWSKKFFIFLYWTITGWSCVRIASASAGRPAFWCAAASIIFILSWFSISVMRSYAFCIGSGSCVGAPGRGTGGGAAWAGGMMGDGVG